VVRRTLKSWAGLEGFLASSRPVPPVEGRGDVAKT
jgi:hypothetical protein